MQTRSPEGSLLRFFDGDFDAALVEARASNRPLLLDCMTQTCIACDQLDKYTFSEPEVAELLNDMFINVKLDATDNPLDVLVVLESFGVRSFPTLLFIDSNQHVHQRLQGFNGPSDVIEAAQATLEATSSPSVTGRDQGPDLV